MVQFLHAISCRTVSLEEKAFTALGRLIGRRPWAVVFIASLTFLVPAPGVFFLKGEGRILGFPMDTDFMTTFALTDSKEYLQYKKAVGVFSDTRSIGLLEIPIGGRSPLSAELLRSAMATEATIAADIRATYHGQGVTFADVCARTSTGAPCTQMSAVSTLLGRGAQAEARLRDLATLESNSTSALARAKWLLRGMPRAADRHILPMLVAVGTTHTFPGGSASDDALAAWLATAKTLTASFDLVDSRQARAFEREAEHRLHALPTVQSLRTSISTSSTIGEESTKIGSSAFPSFIVAIVLMSGYMVLFLGAETRQGEDTQVLVILAGVSIPFLSTFASMGVCGLCGLSLNVLVLMAPFLGLAVGVDAVFLVISSIAASGKDEPDPLWVMALAVPRAGVAITATTLTSVAAFATAAFSCLNFPGFFVFSLMVVFILMFNWLGMLTLLPALVVINERRIAQNRLDVLFCRKRKQVGERPGLLARAAAGRRCRKLIAFHLAPLVEKSLACQMVGATVWIGLLVFGVVFLPGLGKGMPDTYLMVDDSPALQHFPDVEAAFGDVVGINAHVYFERPRLGDPAFRRSLANYTAALGRRGDAIAPADCWISSLAGSLPAGATAEQASGAARQFLASAAGARYEVDARIGADGEVEGARCHLFLWQSQDPARRAAQAEDLIAFTESAGVSAIAYHLSWPTQVVRYRESLALTVSSTLYAGIGVAASMLLTLPVHLTILAVANVAAVVTVLFGYMAATGLTCNPITYTILLMSLGFCVDYSCHVAHFADYGVKPGTPWDKRMGRSLRECGFDVMQGCMTAFLGVVVLGLNPAVAFRIFAATSVVITGLGGIFALWGLPSILALVARASHGGSAAAHMADDKPDLDEEPELEPVPDDFGSKASKPMRRTISFGRVNSMRSMNSMRSRCSKLDDVLEQLEAQIERGPVDSFATSRWLQIESDDRSRLERVLQIESEAPAFDSVPTDHTARVEMGKEESLRSKASKWLRKGPSPTRMALGAASASLPFDAVLTNHEPRNEFGHHDSVSSRSSRWLRKGKFDFLFGTHPFGFPEQFESRSQPCATAFGQQTRSV